MRGQGGGLWPGREYRNLVGGLSGALEGWAVERCMGGSRRVWQEACVGDLQGFQNTGGGMGRKSAGHVWVPSVLVSCGGMTVI